MKFIDIARYIINAEFPYEKTASIDDLITKQALFLDEYSNWFASISIKLLNQETIMTDLGKVLTSPISSIPSGAAPVFDLIFINAYNFKKEDIFSQLESYITTSGLTPEEQIDLANAFYNSYIGLGLCSWVEIARAIWHKCCSSAGNQSALSQLDTIETDINTSQICIELKENTLNLAERIRSSLQSPRE